MRFREKNILIISPESWGINMLSKHHYALALAKKNNSVFFLNPPSPNHARIEILEGPPNIKIINYSPFIRGSNRLTGVLSPLADYINQVDIKKLREAINQPIDIVWNFDPFRFQNFNLFKPAFCIFHPVDFVNSTINLQAASTSDVIFSVAKPILDNYSSVKTPSFFINHGLSPSFLDLDENVREKKDSIIRCGYVGNLLSHAIHFENLTQIVKENESIEFHFVGPYQSSNLGNFKSSEQLQKILRFQNVRFYGEKPPTEVAKLINGFDLFLICYHPEKAGKLVSNNHKILEYLSTGKAVVSSYTSTYEHYTTDLIEMVKNSKDLPLLFKETIKKIEHLNSPYHQKRRKEFAAQNSYDNHLKEIEAIISNRIN